MSFEINNSLLFFKSIKTFSKSIKSFQLTLSRFLSLFSIWPCNKRDNVQRLGHYGENNTLQADQDPDLPDEAPLKYKYF